MVSTLVVGLNSYATLAEADSYLGDSVRASSAWEGFDPEFKTKALITSARILEKQKWKGTPTPVQVAVSAVVAAGGAGYVTGDLLTVVGGVFGSPAVFKVTASSGIVTAVTPSDEGSYTTAPSNPVSTSGGTGTGCTLTITFSEQTMLWPRSGVTDKYGETVDSDTVPIQIEQAQMELAFDLTQDSSIETSAGTGSNTKRLKAGPVEVEYFRPTGGVAGAGGPRFSPEVMELIAQFLAGSTTSGVAGSYVTGTDVIGFIPIDGGLFGLSGAL